MLILVLLNSGLMMSKGFASASQQAKRPKTLEAIVLSQRLNDCLPPFKTHRWNGLACINTGDILTIAHWRCCLESNGWEDMEIYGVSKRGIVISSLAQWHSQCGYVSASVRAAESETI